MTKNERIVLGSGKLYGMEFDGTVPDVAEICVEENRMGYISGGCTLEYKPTRYEAKDDLGYVVKTILTEEEVTMKSGIMTFDGNTIAKLCETGRVTETETERIVLIGGVANRTGKKYLLCFHHEDAVDGDIWVLIVGQNQSGFSLAFAKDKETVIDAEFKALPDIDKEGTLIKYIEEVKSGAASGEPEEETGEETT